MGREGGRRSGWRGHIAMADSYWCMAKTAQYCIILQLNKLNNPKVRGVEKEEGKTFKKMCEYKGKEGI